MYAEAIKIADSVMPDVVLESVDTTLDTSYKIIYACLHNELKNLKDQSNIVSINCLKTKTLKKCTEILLSSHAELLHNRSLIVQELFTLHQIANCLYRYNNEYLNLSYPEYRSRVFYPNIVYILIRILPRAQKFLQTTIKSVYSEICRKSYGIIFSHINTFYLDHDVIKTDVLYEFLGNGLKKFNPLQLNDITSFYKNSFRCVFNYYFKKEKRISTVYDSVWEIEQDENFISVPVRLGLYRDVLYELQTKKFYEKSPTMTQLSYNFNVFKNVIVDNEFQNMYFSTYKDKFLLNNNEYKLMKLYNEDINENDILLKIKELPTIYKLLKCVHIINPNTKPYNEMLIKPMMVKNAVLEELMLPFKNMFSNDCIHSILDKVAENFTKTILSGEYINLFSLSNIKIDQITFIQQVKKFIGLCLKEGIKYKW